MYWIDKVNFKSQKTNKLDCCLVQTFSKTLFSKPFVLKLFIVYNTND